MKAPSVNNAKRLVAIIVEVEAPWEMSCALREVGCALTVQSADK